MQNTIFLIILYACEAAQSERIYYSVLYQSLIMSFCHFFKYYKRNKHKRKEGRKQRHRRNYRNEEEKEEWWQDRLM
jgi:hypothetical protein